MKDDLFEESKRIATKVVNNIEGYGVFGVELFIKDNDVFFSEVSPRPHDTGLVTLITQDLSEFALQDAIKLTKQSIKVSAITLDHCFIIIAISLLNKGFLSICGYDNQSKD